MTEAGTKMDNRAHQTIGPTLICVGVIGVAVIVLNAFGGFTEGARIPCQHCATSPKALLPLAAGFVALVAVVGVQLAWSVIADEVDDGE
jgi:hypothetical protein